MMDIYDLSIKDINNEDIKMSEFKGKVLLIVNTATGCGFTSQYEGLEKIYRKYKNDGFELLDFPCNQFANQAPGSNDEIKEFCQLNYDVTFKQFSKIDVNGKNEERLYTYLKSQKGGVFGKNIKWNFTKFLVDQSGNVVKRYAPTVVFKKIEKDIEMLLVK